MGTGWGSTNPWMKKIRIFGLKGGLEFANKDSLESLQGQGYLFYSFGMFFYLRSPKSIYSFSYRITSLIFLFLTGEPFDYSVRMTFIEVVEKLGEGGFGEVHLGNDRFLN